MNNEVMLNIPLEVANDTCIKSYKILDGDKVVKYYERAPHPQDKPAVVAHGSIIIKPIYLGEWLDQTDAYLKVQEEKRAQLQKDKKAGIVDRSGRVRTQKEIKEEELRKAQNLLAELLLNNETPTEKQLQKLQKAGILEEEAEQ